MLLLMLNQQSNYNLILMVSQRSTIASEEMLSCTHCTHEAHIIISYCIALFMHTQTSEISNILHAFTILHPDVNLEIARVGGSNETSDSKHLSTSGFRVLVAKVFICNVAILQIYSHGKRAHEHLSHFPILLSIISFTDYI